MVDLGLLQGLATLVLAVVALLITLWLSFSSPQAKLAKLQITDRIQSQREDHYARLDQQVFRRLSLLIASIPPPPFIDKTRYLFRELRLVYDTTAIRNSRFYSDAMRHLHSDFPQLQKDIDDVEQRVSKLDKDVSSAELETENTQ